MTPVEELTEQQLAEAAALRDEWLPVALSTARCDRPAAEAAVAAAYRTAGLAPPKRMIWVDSPLHGVLTAVDLRESGDTMVADELLGVTYPPSRAGGPDAPWEDQQHSLRYRRKWSTGPLVYGLELSFLGSTCARQVLGRIWAEDFGDERPEYDSPRHRELSRRWDLARPLVERFQGRCGVFTPWGDADDLRLDRYVGDAVGLPPFPRLDAVLAAMDELGWWWPLRTTAVLADRPVAVHRDARGRLHHADGPAIRFADGFGLYFLGGVDTDAELVHRGWPLERIVVCSDEELRRHAIELAGWERLLADAELVQVGQDEPDPEHPGRVLRLYELPRSRWWQDPMNEEPARVVVVADTVPGDTSPGDTSPGPAGAHRRHVLYLNPQFDTDEEVDDLGPAEFATLARHIDRLLREP